MRGRRLDLMLVFAALFATYAYFYSGTSPNPNSRYDLTRAIVEQNRLSIDSYRSNTLDKSFFRGHYYSDKAPGASFFVVPVYAVAFHTASLATSFQDARRSYPIQNVLFHLVQVFGAGLPGALLGTLLFRTLRDESTREADDDSVEARATRRKNALLATLFVCLGTGYFAYSTLFYGHVLAGGALYLLYDAAVRRRDFRIAGAATGFAILVEYPVAPAALFLGAFALWTAPRSDWKRNVARYCLAGAPFAIVLGAYNRAITGSPFTLSYAAVHPQFQEMMGKGFFGVTLPSPTVVVRLLFGGWRGIFVTGPVLMAIFAGVAPCWRKNRPAAICGAVVVVYFLLMNASYGMWWGGVASYARHLVPALPFFAPFVYYALAESPRWLRRSILVLGGVSMTNALVIVATHAHGSEYDWFPLRSAYAALWNGDVGQSLYHSAVLHGALLVPHQGTNLGAVLLGERTPMSLLPLLVLAVAWCVAWRAATKRQGTLA